MSLMYDIDTLKIILAQLVDDLGGVAVIDSTLLSSNLKNNKIKSLEMRIEEEKLILEVYENEDKDSE